MEHKDSSGHAGQLRSGYVQWMTAGSGVVHAEMPSAEFMRTGGRMHGFQLWVNLPQREKMIKPRYQEIPSSRIPKVTSADGLVSVSVIAGEAMGEKAVIETRTPIIYLHYRLRSEEHTSELQSLRHLVCRLLLEKKKKTKITKIIIKEKQYTNCASKTADISLQ